jgi:hypothetical protein
VQPGSQDHFAHADFLPAAADRRTHPGDDLLSLVAADPDLTLDEVVVIFRRRLPLRRE